MRAKLAQLRALGDASAENATTPTSELLMAVHHYFTQSASCARLVPAPGPHMWLNERPQLPKDVFDASIQP